MKLFMTTLALAVGISTASASAFEPLHGRCDVSIGEKPDSLRLEIRRGDCMERHQCGTNDNDLAAPRFEGVTVADLHGPDRSNVSATIRGEAGLLVCSGAIREGELTGSSLFTPNADFVDRMGKMGFHDYDSDKLEAYTMLDVTSEFAQSLKDAGIHGIDSGNLIALRIFNATPEFVHSMTALGYKLPDAGELISMRVQGVNPEEVKELRDLGYQPTFDQLVQVRIFKVTPDFIRRMRDRGFKNLTLEKLVQIRIFNLAD